MRVMEVIKKVLLIAWILLLVGCRSPAKTITTEAITNTIIPPTATISDTPEPSSTPIPTDTPLPFPTFTVAPTDSPTAPPQMWFKKTNMPTARWGLSTSVVDDLIYAIGGFGGLTAVEVYDPATDTWTSKADMPTGRGFLTTSVVDGKIYAIGGNSGPSIWGKTLDVVEVYDPETDTWSSRRGMTTPRDGFSSNTIDGKILAFGGGIVKDIESWETLRSSEVYEPATNSWTETADMNRARDTFTSVVVNNKILTIGGFSPYEEMYNPETDTWEKMAAMPKVRIGTAAGVINGKVYVFGGDEEGGGPPTSVVFEYDHETDSWVILPEMPFEALGMSASVVNGKVYIIGGSERAYPHRPPQLSTVWEFIPEP